MARQLWVKPGDFGQGGPDSLGHSEPNAFPALRRCSSADANRAAMGAGNWLVGVAQEVREIVQALAVPEPAQFAIENDGPVLALAAEQIRVRGHLRPARSIGWARVLSLARAHRRFPSQ